MPNDAQQTAPPQTDPPSSSPTGYDLRIHSALLVATIPHPRRPGARQPMPEWVMMVHASIRSFQGPRGRTCTASIKAVGERVRKSRSQASMAVSYLEAEGFVVRVDGGLRATVPGLIGPVDVYESGVVYPLPAAPPTVNPVDAPPSILLTPTVNPVDGSVNPVDGPPAPPNKEEKTVRVAAARAHAAARTREEPPRDATHAAAAGEKEEGEKKGVNRTAELLTTRGVDAPVARRLSAEHGDRVEAMVERYDAERAGGKAIGPGWLVAAVEEGYAPLAQAPPSGASRSSASRLLTHAEAVAELDRLRGNTGAGAVRGPTFTDFFEPVRQGEATLFRRKTPAAPVST